MCMYTCIIVCLCACVNIPAHLFVFFMLLYCIPDVFLAQVFKFDFLFSSNAKDK